jgi:DNA anti-recombination protein RmuC
MEAMRDSWTDERLDHFRARVDERFDRVDERFEQIDKRFEQVDKRFERIESDIREMRSEMNEGFKSMQRMMLYGVIALSASIVTGFGAMAGLLGS